MGWLGHTAIPGATLPGCSPFHDAGRRTKHAFCLPFCANPECEGKMTATGHGGADTEERSRARARTRSRGRASVRGPRIVRAAAPGSVAALAALGSLVAGAGIYGARFSPRNGSARAWYRRLEKPPFNPPQSVFPPVWTALYALIALSGWRVWRRPGGRKRSAALALWGGQLVANAAWSKLFFGDRRPGAALADSVALLASIGAYTAVTRKVDRRAAVMMLPYAAWVSFATLLNAEIVRRNP